MGKVLRIAVREYNEAVRTKAFFIGIFLAPVLMGGGMFAAILMEDHVDVNDKTIAVVDRSGVLAESLLTAVNARNASEVMDPETGKKVQPNYRIEVAEPSDDADAQRLALSQRVRDRELLAFVEIGPDVLEPGEDAERARIAYHSDNVMFNDVRRWLDATINRQLRMRRVADAQLDQATIDQVTRHVQVERLSLLSVDEETGLVRPAERTNQGQAMAAPMILVMLLFMMIMIGAMPLLHSVLEEKTQRIAEVLFGSARPFEIMAGKLLGNLGVSMTAATVYVVGGLIVTQRMGWGDYVPYALLPWFFVYTIAAVSMCGAMCIAVGSACNDAKEVQSLMLPVMLPIMIPMFVLVPVMKEPLSTFATALSLFPPCTPLLMMLRQSTPGGIPAWQPWVGLIGMTACTALYVWAAGRIFRIGVLMQGKSPKLTDLARWAIRG